MANPFEVQVPDALKALMQFDTAYRDTRKETARNSLAELMGSANPDFKQASMKLLAGGDLEGGIAMANLARANAQEDWNRTYQTGMLDVARRNADSTRITATKAAPTIAKVGTKDGRTQTVIVNPSTGETQPVGEPIGDEVKLTSADRKAIFDAEDENGKLESTIAALKRAKELNGQIFTGAGASLRSTIGTSGIPGANLIADPAKSAATAEWDQIMSGESIKNMSATLKGASTDREMNKFISIAANTSLPPQVRQNAIDRLLELSQRQKIINSDRMNQLRGGQYYKKDGGQSGAIPPSMNKPNPDVGGIQNGQRARNPQTGQIIEYRDGQWSPVQ